MDVPRATKPFGNRTDAGLKLAAELRLRRVKEPVVLGLARGGVPVASVVARAIGAPLGVILALRLPVPGQPEVAAGAVAPGVRFIVDEVVRELEISTEYLTIVAEELEKQLAERAQLFQSHLSADLRGRNVVIIDDGIASGATAAAAVKSVRIAGARHVAVAAPVASRAGLETVRIADEVIVTFIPEAFGVVSNHYEEFAQVSDDDVKQLLGA